MRKKHGSRQNKMFVVAVIFITVFIFVGNKAFAAENLFNADSNTISLWRFNDAFGSVAIDEMGRNNGTAIGTSIVDGKFGKARYFNGATDYVVVPNDASLNNLTQFTVETWVNPQGFDLTCWASAQGIVAKGDFDIYAKNGIDLVMGRNMDDYCYAATNFNSLNFQGYVSSHDGAYITPGGSIVSPWYTPNEWYYVAYTYNGSDLNLYVNGNLVSSTSSPGLVINNSDPLFINHHTWANGSQSSQRMRGLIDEVRISNTARSAQEIANNYDLANGVVSQPPTISALAQFKADGVTSIVEGSSMPQNAVVLGATVNSSSTNQIQLQVELSTSSAFTSFLTATSTFVASGTFATTTFQNLVDGQYFWRAKVVDSSGLESAWQEFGIARVSDFTVQEPVLIIPGIMGSLPDSNGQLVLDPILHTYDNLYDNLAAVGYVPNVTLFTLPYDWERSNALSAVELKNKISEIRSLCNCQKVNVIAHSMGGLVARYYIESSLYQNDINYLALLGTPNSGAPSDYTMWEAGDMPFSFENSVAKSIYWAKVYALGYDSIFDYIRTGPLKSIQELLPDYNYLSNYGDGSLIAYPVNNPRNSFLDSFLNIPGNIGTLEKGGVRVINISGDNQKNDTIIGIKVVHDNSRLPLWEDGYPKNFDINFLDDSGFVRGRGDGTVPLSSASLLNVISASSTIINSSHGDLPTKGINNIFNFIVAGRQTSGQSAVTPLINRILIVSVHSPAHIQVIDPVGRVVGDNSISNSLGGTIPLAYYSNGQNGYGEFVTIPNPIDGQYTIKTLGTGTGSYEIEANFVDNSTSTSAVFSGNTQTGLAGDLHFDFSSSSPAQATIVPVDSVAPTTTISMSGMSGSNNWFTSDVLVTLSAQDNAGGTGVFKTEYSLDNGQTWKVYVNPITSSAEGVSAMLCRSSDFVGNVEQAKSLQVKIDKTAPEAKIYFDKIAKNLKVEGVDKLSSTTVVMASQSNPDSKDIDDDIKHKDDESEPSHANGADKGIVIYKISDEAGHITTLKFRRIGGENHNIEAALDSIQYDNSAVITIPKTTLNYEWPLDKNKNFKSLSQEIIAKGKFEIKAQYMQKQNKTQISVKEGKKKAQNLSVSGMVIIKLSTLAGKLSWEY